MFNLRTIVVVLLPLFILGCSQSATSVFNKKEIYAQHLQYTKVSKVIYNNDVIALFNATYLNSVNSSKWDNKNQNFLLSLYNTQDDTKYDITLNGKTTKNIVLVNKKNKLYTNIAYKNHWAKYYIYSFKNDDNNTIELKASNGLGSTTIKFVKE